jgi:hypothetical protein
VVFVDMVTGPRTDWELVAEHSGLVSVRVQSDFERVRPVALFVRGHGTE